MNNMHLSVTSVGLASTRITAIVPPSAGACSGEAFIATKDDTSFLVRPISPLMLKVYPYFDYASDPEHIFLEYTTFDAK